MGDPLAVVLNAEGLSTGRMQAISRPIRFAETTFILPRGCRAYRQGADISPQRSDLPAIPMSAPGAGPRRRRLWPVRQRRSRHLRGKGRAGPNRDSAGWRSRGGRQAGFTAAASVGAEISGRTGAIGFQYARRHRDRSSSSVCRRPAVPRHSGRIGTALRWSLQALMAMCFGMKSPKHAAVSIMLYAQVPRAASTSRRDLRPPEHSRKIRRPAAPMSR